MKNKKSVIIMSLLMIGSLNAKRMQQKNVTSQTTAPQRSSVTQSIPSMQAPQQPLIKNAGAYHLIPINGQTLKQFDLCPLFGKEGGLYSVFNTKARTYSGQIAARFEYEHVNQNAPCMILLAGKFGNCNRRLIQLKSLDQFKLSDVTGLDPALCAGHSLNNGRLMRDYVLTGNMQDLKKLHDIEGSADFLLDLKIGSWLNVEVVRDKFLDLRKELGVDEVDVSAISTVSLFDSRLPEKPGFAVFSEQEFKYVQRVKDSIIEGLKRDNYVHVMIIGNEEAVEALGHYFCFVIAKSGNEIQYIVLDTSPTAYHLQEKSHEKDRLMFVIENIEQGKSDINVINLRTRFLR